MSDCRGGRLLGGLIVQGLSRPALLQSVVQLGSEVL